ncbi:MAG: Selenoprotein O and cysteine-containing homologs [uncultured Sphingosinicella sp.]|uniref:Selenoprotein O and cysteine-containing homologs n=1 Tax=uncultured Sphingosinicella sp. TaxID=478748 RepID=A0A6J4TPE9_9SPHN|nr:YdiU family protein [uncultured Sphingosinicella sp.]CAA9528442.1 MAG: Selenoprotein O and cysteine-containing homologs [uncultured Sphingosinicella sp.]
MRTSPQPSRYRPEKAILSLGEAFYDPVEAANFPQTILRFRNQRWAEAVGLGGLGEEQWLRHFGRFEPLPDTLPQPLALRYHGHQFRVYNPDIGDGRGFLFAQLRDNADRLLDLGTKGSGQTPYSRFGDGRLTLKGGIREVLATEMLEALGVETSKTFSLIETGEALERNDEPSPTRSSVLVRLQHSHIRIGAFQRLAYFGEEENLRILTDYGLRHYYGDPGGGADAPARLLTHVSRETARLAASYIAAGFVHGVLNSDNIAITAESFDYGPWRWTPYWDGRFTAAYFDHAGLYAFGRQPEAIHWDLVQLAASLRLIADVEALTPALDAYPPAFQKNLREAICARLGVVPQGEEPDNALLAAIEAGLGQQTVTLDRFFFDWRSGRRRAPPRADGDYDGEHFAQFRSLVADYQPAADTAHAYWSDAEPCSMHIEEVEAIWSRIDEADDWSAFEAKVAAVRRMGEAMGQP